MSIVLGIDAGQSGTRLTVVGPNGLELTWADRGVPAGITPAQAMTGFLLESTAEKLRHLGVEELRAVGAGLTGFHAGAEEAPGVLAAWARRLGVRRLLLADDAVTSYLGALGAGAGAVVAAGTGVTVLASDGRSSVRVNGWGPTLGDEGGGYWIGQQGLRSAFRYIDGRSGSRLLAEMAREVFGELTRLPALLAASTTRTSLVAGFARKVADAAHAGDTSAVTVWAAAGKELAWSVIAALRQLTPDPPARNTIRHVSWNGALFQAGDLLLRPFRATLERSDPKIEVVHPSSDSLAGALTLTGANDLSSFGVLVDAAHIE